MAPGAPTVRTTCPYCGVGCGVAGSPGEARTVEVAGDTAHPANFGRLCSKGAALGRTVGLEGRLLHPEIGGRKVSWAKAADHVARSFLRTIARHGPDSVAFYVSGQLLTEDYYAANKLMKGFIGSANIDTNSRLCMASAVAAHKQAFGADLVPGCYEDLDLADLIVFAGHNAAWTHPVLVRRMEAAKARGQKWACIDPRRTDTAELSDLHLPLAPQTDVRLWNGLLAFMVNTGAVDRAYLAAHVNGFEAVETALLRDDQSLDAVAADCGVDADDLWAFYRLFAATPKTVSLFSMGSNQSSQGVAKGLAIINAHLATGRVGKPGACPFSITGQPNAMGGRETGGLANTLAAHMDFGEAERARVRRFWSSPIIAARPGLKAVDMFEAIHDGRVKAVWIMATNPAVSMPDAARVREALARCPLVVVSEAVAETDTTAFAHVKLPALTWGERNGTVTNSERRISRQRPLFPPPGEARADWAIVADVATRMGHADAFNWRSSADVFREYVRLTAYENPGPEGARRLLDLAPLATADYNNLEPVQWPVTRRGGTARLFTDGRFQTPDGRARMVPVEPGQPAEPVSEAFPLWLNTGRVRDQWHTMTRTALAPELNLHTPEPYVEIHPSDAAKAGLADGALAAVRTPRGEAIAVARVTDRQRKGGLFMPMHWTRTYAPQGRSNGLIGPYRDALSGQPEFKHSPAQLSPWGETWRGFCVSRTPVEAPARSALAWRRIHREHAEQYEFAGRGDQTERDRVARALGGSAGELLSLDDPATGAFRRAWVVAGRLERVLFITRGRLPPRDWLLALFGQNALSREDRMTLLAGRPLGPVEDVGPLVCACLKVGAVAIEKARAAGAVTVEAVGAVTGAGTNCGSCRAEIARLVSPTEISRAA
jgi:assimilatory nitrate reductase catalytic subunit